MNAIFYQPLTWITTISIVFALAAFAGFRRSKGAIRIVCAVIGSGFLLFEAWVLVSVFSPGLIDARFRTYQAFYDAIKPGMTRFQVLASLESHYPAEGPRHRPKIITDTAGELGFFMDPETSYEPNCEGIFLDFKEGKVVRKHYSRD